MQLPIQPKRHRIICDLLLAGQTYRDIAYKFGVTPARIESIANKYEVRIPFEYRPQAKPLSEPKTPLKVNDIKPDDMASRIAKARALEEARLKAVEEEEALKIAKLGVMYDTRSQAWKEAGKAGRVKLLALEEARIQAGEEVKAAMITPFRAWKNRVEEANRLRVQKLWIAQEKRVAEQEIAEMKAYKKARRDAERKKLLRIWDIINLLHEGVNYTHVAKRYSVSRTRIEQIVSPYLLLTKIELDFKITKRIFDEIEHDLAANRTIDEMCGKHGKTKTELYNIYKKHCGNSLTEVIRQNRDERIAFDFSMGLTARQIADKYSALYPDMSISIDMVYVITGQHGVGRAGKKLSVGCNLDKKIIRILRNKLEQGWTQAGVANYLNQQGYKTVFGKKFNRGNVSAIFRTYLR